MSLQSRFLILYIFASTYCHGFHKYNRRNDEPLNEDDIKHLRSIFAQSKTVRLLPNPFQPERRSFEDNLFHSNKERYFAHNRERQRSAPSSYSVDPEEREIDSIVETASPQQTKAALSSKPQEEIAPLVEQKLPSVDVKQQRVPQHSYTQERIQKSEIAPKQTSDLYFIALVAGCSGAAVFGVIAAGFCWYKLQKNAKAAAEADYPAYGVTGPCQEHVSPPNGDRKLAQSAQMYHYQHQKQQMIAIEKAGSDRHVSTSDLDSEEENEEGDYTVYECPGLASTGEMEVKNPLFQDESTPASPPVTVRDTDK